MGLFDVLLGRSKPKKANLDDLFALPDAAITLESATRFTPSGRGAVSYRSVEGTAFSSTQDEIKELLSGEIGTSIDSSVDKYGFTWIVISHDSADASGLVTDLHAVNTSLESQGFGSMLLCSLMYFTNPNGDRLALVYLYKRGTFYPFVPVDARRQQRNRALEMQVRGTLSNDVKIESDLSRWSPVWGAPGL